MKKLLSLAFAFIFVLSLNAQKENTLLNGFRLTGLWGGTSNGFIELDNEFSLNNNGYFVFEINRDFLIGWSGYGNGTTLDSGDKVEINGNDLLLGYTFNSDQVVHLTSYLKFGKGSLEISGETDDDIFVFEPSLGAELNITRWFRLGLDGGYRFVNHVNTAGYTDSDFSSPFVALRFKFGWSWGGSKKKVSFSRDF